MRTAPPAILLVFLLLPAAAGARDEPYLDLVSSWRAEPGVFVDEAAVTLEPLLPEGHLVPAVLKDGVFGFAPVAGGRRLVALQGASFWIDRDGDASLRDESPLEAGAADGARHRTFTLPVEIDGDPLPFAVPVAVRWRPGPAPARLGWRPSLSRTGVLEAGGHAHAFRLVDGDGDLRFASASADRLRIDLDADGTLDAGPWSRESFAPGASLSLAGARWRVDAGGPHGWWVRLRRQADGPVRRAAPHDALLRAATAPGTPDDLREQARVLGHAAGRGAMDRAARALAEAVDGRPRLALDLRVAAARWRAWEGGAGDVAAALRLADEFPEAAREDLARQLSTLRVEEGVARLAAALESDRIDRRRLALAALEPNPMPMVGRALYARLAREEDPRLRARLADATHDRIRPARLAAAVESVEDAPDLRARIVAADGLVRMGLERPAVRETVVAMLDDPRVSTEAHICLLDAIRSGTAPALVDAVAGRLAARERAVRIAAAEALGRLRVARSIPPLIRRLGDEDDDRVRMAVGDALYALTGQQMLDFEEKWRDWWERFGAAYRVPVRPPQPRPRGVGERRSVATFFGVPILSGRVVFLIDRSASMARRDSVEGLSRLQVAVTEVLEAAERLPRGTAINVVAFNDGTWRWRRRLTPLGTRLRRLLARDLAALEPGGGTWLYEGLETAFADPGVETLFVLSDGEPSGGRFTAPDAIVREVEVLNKLARATIHTIAVGERSPLLERLARAHGGTHVRR